MSEVKELKRNHRAFVKELPQLMLEHYGRVAVFSGKTNRGVFPDRKSAISFGDMNFGRGNFIAQEIEHQKPILIPSCARG